MSLDTDLAVMRTDESSNSINNLLKAKGFVKSHTLISVIVAAAISIASYFASNTLSSSYLENEMQRCHYHTLVSMRKPNHKWEISEIYFSKLNNGEYRVTATKLPGAEFKDTALLNLSNPTLPSMLYPQQFQKTSRSASPWTGHPQDDASFGDPNDLPSDAAGLSPVDTLQVAAQHVKQVYGQPATPKLCLPSDVPTLYPFKVHPLCIIREMRAEGFPHAIKTYYPTGSFPNTQSWADFSMDFMERNSSLN